MDLRAARFTYYLLTTHLLPTNYPPPTNLLRTHRWISEQLEQLERGKRREAAALAERARQQEISRLAQQEIAAEMARQQEIAARAAAEIAAEIASSISDEAEIAAGRGVVGAAPPTFALEAGNQLAVAGAGAGGAVHAADSTAKPAPSPPCRSPLAPLNRSGGFGTAVKEKAEGGATATRAGTLPSTPVCQATQREVTPAKYPNPNPNPAPAPAPTPNPNPIPNPSPNPDPTQVTPAKYSQRVDRARAANRQRSAQRISLSCAKSPPESPAIHPLGLAAPPGLAPTAGCPVSPRC